MSTNTNGHNGSPAMRVMDQAIELAIQERSPYPEYAAFVDADTVGTAEDVKRAFDEGRAVVLVTAAGETSVLLPESVLG